MNTKRCFFLSVLIFFACFPSVSLAQGSDSSREEALKTIKIDMKETKSLCDKLNATWAEIVIENKKSLQGWATSPASRMKASYDKLLTNLNNGVKYAGSIRKKANSLCNAAGNIDMGANPEGTRQLINQGIIAQQGLRANVENARVIMKENKTLGKVAEFQTRVGEALKEKQQAIENLEKQAKELQSSPAESDRDKFVKTMRLVAIYSEIQQNFFSVQRDMVKIYAYMVARAKGSQSEYEDAFGDPLEIVTVTDGLVSGTGEMVDWSNDLLDLIVNFPIDGLGGAYSDKYREAFDRAYNKLYYGE